MAVQAAGLEQPAVHFHNRKGQCCGSRDFRDATQSILGSLCSAALPVDWGPVGALV